MATHTLEHGRAVRASDGTPAARSPRRARWVLAAILVVCALLRLALLASILGRLDGDEAASGISARLILEGRFPLYFPDPWAYLGAIEQYLQAPLLALDPTSPFLLRLPQVALSVLSCWLVALVARRCLDHPWAGEIAAALFTVGPFYSLAWSFKTRTYAAALFLGLAGLVLALGTDPRARRAELRAATFGLVCGLAFWTNWTAAFLLLPAAIWWLGVIRGQRRRLVADAVGGFALGMLPFAIAATWGRLPTIFDRVIYDPPMGERVKALFGPVLGMFIGVRRPPPAAADVAILPDPLPLVVAAAGLVAILVAVGIRRRGLGALLTLRPGAAPGDVLLLAAVVTPALYVLSKFASLTEEPRYLFVLYGILPVGLAALVPRRRPAGAIVAVVLAGLLGATTVDGVVTTYATDGLGPNAKPETSTGRIARVHTEDLPAVVDALEAEGAQHVWAGYWLAHPLQFVARDRVTVASWEAPRFQEDYNAVWGAPAAAYAAPVGQDADEVAATLDALGATYRRRQVASVVLFLDVSPTFRPQTYAVRIHELGLVPVDP